MEYISKHSITGKGLVYVVDTYDYTLGTTVEFDDQEFIIIGIESFSKLMNPIIKGSTIGLIVRKKNGDTKDAKR